MYSSRQMITHHAAARHLGDRMARIAIAWLVSIALVLPGQAAAELRIGITQAMYVRDSLAYDQWANYLSTRTGQPVQFVYRRSYNEIQELLRLGDLHFAWICGYPYVRGVDAGFLRYVATPEFKGDARYRIYLLVPANSSAQTLADLADGIFAFSDPDSVSFRALIAGHFTKGRPIADLDRAFRLHFFTYSHAETIKAVADHVADGGSVDGQVWEALTLESPEITRRTRVIARTGDYGLPPFVASKRADDAQIAALQRALFGMNADAEGQRLLDVLQLTRFARHQSSLYDSIRKDLDLAPRVTTANP